MNLVVQMKQLKIIVFLIFTLGIANEIDAEIIENLDFYMEMEIFEEEMDQFMEEDEKSNESSPTSNKDQEENS